MQELEDKFYRLKEEHVTLKRQSHLADYQVKHLNTKLARLLNDKKCLLASAGRSGREVELQELVLDTSDQCELLLRDNVRLKERQMVMRSELEATSDKRQARTGSGYSYVRSRVDSGLQNNRNRSKSSSTLSLNRVHFASDCLTSSSRPVTAKPSVKPSVATGRLPAFVFQLLTEAREEMRRMEETIVAQQLTLDQLIVEREDGGGGKKQCPHDGDGAYAPAARRSVRGGDSSKPSSKHYAAASASLGLSVSSTNKNSTDKTYIAHESTLNFKQREQRELHLNETHNADQFGGTSGGNANSIGIGQLQSAQADADGTEQLPPHTHSHHHDHHDHDHRPSSQSSHLNACNGVMSNKVAANANGQSQPSSVAHYVDRLRKELSEEKATSEQLRRELMAGNSAHRTNEQLDQHVRQLEKENLILRDYFEKCIGSCLTEMSSGQQQQRQSQSNSQSQNHHLNLTTYLTPLAD